MKKITRLTETDLTRLVKKIMNEQRFPDTVPYEKEYQTSLQKLENKDYIELQTSPPLRLKKYLEENKMDGMLRVHKSDSNKYLYMKPQEDSNKYQIFYFNMDEFNIYANIMDSYAKNVEVVEKFQEMI
jgi:hypothetical protein